MEYKSLSKYEKQHHPSIHYTGSVEGMKKLGSGERMINVCVADSTYIIYQLKLNNAMQKGVL